MNHILNLELPEDIYQSLMKKAKQTGCSPDELAIECLKLALLKIANDPIEKFIGTVHSDIPDWADEHDKYLGKTLMEEMKKKEPGK
jgi:hypothetical protein